MTDYKPPDYEPPDTTGEGGLIPHPHLATEHIQLVIGDTDVDGKTPVNSLTGLVLRSDGKAVVGLLPDSPAAELGLDECARRIELPIDWKFIAERDAKTELLDNLADMAAMPPGSVDGRQRWRTRPTKEKK